MTRFGLSAFVTLLGSLLSVASASAAEQWVTYEGGDGPGQGKHVVLVSGDEEYRSEEGLPMLARILAERHGFKATVLFAVNPETGEIDPNFNSNIPGLDQLADADLMIIATRWRNLPAEQLKPIDAFLKAGKPVIGLRTATHAIKTNAPGWEHYSDGYKGPKKRWEGGFGRVVLGEQWVAHHGAHGKESTLGLIAPGAEDHSITNGIDDGDIWGDTDVYAVGLPLPGDSRPLVLGQVLSGMKPTDPPVDGEKNDPMMPVAWVKSYQIPGGEKGRAVTTTMGSATDLASEGLRRLVVNAAYDLVGLDVPEGGTNVEIVGEYKPSPFAHNGFKKGVKPSDLAVE